LQPESDTSSLASDISLGISSASAIVWR